MELEVWGARGTSPVSGSRFNHYGGHTACLALRAGEDLVVLDAGSGAAALGEKLVRSDIRRVHVLLSHFHHDHVMGLPYLVLGAGAGRRLAIHACGLTADMLRDSLYRLFSEPYFPAQETQLFSGVSLHAHAAGDAFSLGEGTRSGGTVAVRAEPLRHPGGASAFQLAGCGKALAYVTDIEESPEPPPALIELCRGADMLVHDTMFTGEEIETRRGWGHSTIEAALALAEAAGVRRLAGFHHNPSHDDLVLSRRDEEIAARRAGAFLLREGQVFHI
ncbi:MAG: MBL fold metallo-hydrolase [Proteobacteria bacterium]|nr:MBL fold metallo-hydrolase [Pseudomonadota bacterium]